MSLLGVRARTSAVAAAAGLTVGVLMVGASAASAVKIPASSHLVAHLVSSSARAETATAGAPAGRVIPLRVMNPTKYAQQKAAANAAYERWAADHPFTSAFSPLALTVPLNKAGMNATGDLAVDSNFEFAPPDTTGAISPSYYFEFVNNALTVYNRSTLAAVSGANTGTQTFTGSSDLNTTDPQIKWDNVAHRFLYVALDVPPSGGTNHLFFGWSKTASPLPLTGSTANWCKYTIATGSALEDYPKLGQDNGFMIIGANEYSPSYVDSPIFAIPLPANGSTTCPSTPTATKFIPTNEFSPEPASIYNSSTTGDVVAINFTQNGLRMFTLTGTTPTLNDLGTVTVPAFSTPASLPQPSPAKSGDVIDTSDTRLTQATAAYDPSPNVKAIAVWTQHTIAAPSGGPSIVRWYELRPGSTSAALVQDGTIDDSAANLFAFNGAIAPTRVGNAAAIDYNTGSGSALVTVRAQARAAGQAAGTMGNETTLATSTQVDDDYTCPSVTGGSRPCRWGDYAGASTDPSAGCGSAVWGSNQDNGVAPAFTNAAVWATQNFELLTDECPKAAFTFSAGTGNTENFDGSGSTDADGSIAKWVWNFGDKTTQTTTVPTTSHTYAAAGTHKVTVSVTDSSGLTVSVSHSVSVA